MVINTVSTALIILDPNAPDPTSPILIPNLNRPFDSKITSVVHTTAEDSAQGGKKILNLIIPQNNTTVSVISYTTKVFEIDIKTSFSELAIDHQGLRELYNVIIPFSTNPAGKTKVMLLIVGDDQGATFNSLRLNAIPLTINPKNFVDNEVLSTVEIPEYSQFVPLEYTSDGQIRGIYFLLAETI